MPYKFGSYVSTYVDPQSIKISEILQNRYMDSFKANDQLALAVDQMQAALPFENDMMRKKELQADLDNKLAQLADRGDFENLGFVIHKEAKDFARKYAPIKENYTRYATAINDLQESIKKGDVNEAYSTLFPAYMVRGYKGFELDANGRVKAGTMFSAPTAVKDPKIMEKLQARLAILKPETFKSKITGYTGEGNMYKFTTEDEVIKIDKADVQDVIDAVLSEPDVKAYVNQFADMKTYAATKDQGAMATVQSMADNYSNVLAELNTKLDDPSLKSQERIQIKNQIEALTAELKQTTEVSKDEQTAYNYIKQKNEDAILAPYQSYGEKAIMQSESHSRSKEFSEQYLKDQEWKLANQGLMVQGKISLADRNGATLDEKATNMRNAWAAAYALEQKLNDPKYTATLSEESLNELKRELKSTKDQALLIQQQMFTAANTVITENDIVKASPDAWKTYTAFKELYPWAKPGEIYIRMQETFADKNGQDYANFQNKYKEKYGGQYTGYAPGDKQHPKVTAAEYRQKYAPGSGSEVTGVFGGQPNPKMVEFFKNNPDGIYEGSVFEEFAPEGAPNYPSSDDIGGDLSQVLKNKFNDKINSQFKEIKTSNTFNYGAIDAPTLQESKNLTAAIHNFFVGKPVTADFTVLDITEDGATDVKGSELAGFKVVDVGWNRVHNIYELKLMGGTDSAPVSKTVHLDGKYLRNSTLDNLLNTPENRMAGVIAEMDMHQPGAVASRQVKVLGMDAHMIVESDGAGNPYIRYVDANWNNFTGDAAILSQKHRQDSNALRSIVNAYNKKSESYAVEF